jgi:hypothetical protein
MTLPEPAATKSDWAPDLSSHPPAPADAGLHCPACGYDLRAATSDLCPECGMVVDREALKVSGIPWAHRRRVGRAAAYVRTVWMFASDSAAVRNEASRPQVGTDAVRFGRVTAAILAVPLVGVFVGLCLMYGALVGGRFSALALPSIPAAVPMRLPGLFLDLAIPWSAGAVLLPVMPVCLTLFALAVTALPRAVFRRGGPAAAALGGYVTSPLLLLPGAIACANMALLLSRWMEETALRNHVVVPLLWTMGAILLLVCLAGVSWRVVQWLRRTSHCGLGRALLGLGELFGLWALAVVVFLVLLPWFVGYVWIAIDSLRA